MKRRSLTLVVCLLATLSLASVGFAAWVISAGDTEQLTGSILVETVSDEKLEIRNIKLDETVYGQSTDVQFVFGKPSSGSTEYHWLKNDKTEKLSILVSFKVYEIKGNEETELDESALASKISLAATFATSSLVVADSNPEKVYAKVVNGTPGISYDDESKTFQFTIELQWGDFFGALGTNPYTLYNASAYSESLANEARTKLTEMFEAMEGASYTVTIDAQYQN